MMGVDNMPLLVSVFFFHYFNYNATRQLQSLCNSNTTQNEHMDMKQS